VAGDADRQHHVARLGGAEMVVVRDAHQQVGQPPDLHQRVLQIRQFDVQHFTLHLPAAQCRVCSLLGGDLLCQGGGPQPEEQFGEVVQESRFVDHRGIVVHPVYREADGEVGGASRAVEYGLEAGQRLRMVDKQVFRG
jgi:hypothetical protein